MMNSYKQYFDYIENAIQNIKEQELNKIEEVSQRFADCIANDGVIHLYGSGHSRIGVEEMFPRYGSFPGFHPIVELSTTFYQQVVGANGIRQSMFIENIEGLASRILDNFVIKPQDCFLLFTTSGTGNVVIDMAIEAKKKNNFVVGITSSENCEVATSKHSSNQKLSCVADIILDNKAPIGDASVHIQNMKSPVGPTSTIGNALIVNLIKVRVAELLIERKYPLHVITHPHFIGKEASSKVFEDVLKEYDRQMKRS